MENLTGRNVKGYELRERIGTGGFGAVYKAYQSTVGREVAMKIILPGFANQPDFIRRFETEAQLIARLEHLHIVPLHDYWRDPDGAYLVMRWLKGGSLREALEQGPYGIEAAALVVNQITSALATAHRANIIHRDLKPGNILLDEDGNAYLADFGIAKDLHDYRPATTEPDAIVGSLDYIAPEQARSEPVTRRTDIYSMGVVLYELLTGKHPFPNVTAVERLYKHLNEPLPTIDSLQADVCDAVNPVIQRATAKNPAERYADALEMAAALSAALQMGGAASPRLEESLTQREQDILLLLVEGRTNKEIAQELFIELTTVKWYVTQIYRKMGVRSRVQAIVRARELNLIERDGAGDISILSNTSLSGEFAAENPYKGLRAFQASDNKDYFGREKITDKLVKRLSETGELARFLAVVGPSGSGKSSLVNAGLIPAVWKGAISGSEKWFVVEMLPGARPLDELEVALTKVAANHAGNIHEHLERDEYGLTRLASLILPGDGSDLLLVIDQFEEVFTLVEDEHMRQHFLDLLYAAVTQPRSRVRVVITLRADFYDRPLQYPQFGELVRSRMETVLPLSAEELERAIARPAEQVGVRFEPGLVASIVGEVNYQPGALPLLQYALTELFEQRNGRTLTRASYQAIGGTVGALAKRADEIYLSLDAAGQEAARQMFLRLVTLGEGTEDTRRRVARSELLAIAGDTDVMDEVIDTYAEYRLLSLDNDPGTRTPTVEVAHEAILREWERLRAWLNESREDVRLQRQVMALAAEWHGAKQDASFLLRGSRLEVFEKWLAETQLALTEKEREYLTASVAERERQSQAEEEQQARELRLAREAAKHAQTAAASQKSAANRLRLLVAVLAVAVIGALALSGLAVNQAQVAQSERDAAEQARATLSANLQHADNLRLALEARNMLPNKPADYQTAVLLALRSLRNGYISEADAVLQDTMKDGLPVLTFHHPNSATLGVAFSPDGRTIASSDENGVVQLSDATTGALIHYFVGHTDAVITVDFSPDGHTLATASVDGTIRIWDVETGDEIHKISETGVVTEAGFSPDGRYLVTSGESDQVIILDSSSGETQRSWAAGQRGVEAVIFSPDGRFILTGGDDNSAKLWDAATGTLAHECGIL